MENDSKLRKILYSRFILPTIAKTDDYIGVETEIPIVELSGGAVDYDVVHQVTDAFIEHFGFESVRRDDDGKIYYAEDKRQGTPYPLTAVITPLKSLSERKRT